MKIEKIIEGLSSPDRQTAATASADLAALIWAGELEESTIITWLECSDSALRATASWAVWDAGGPPAALSRLIDLGPNDNNPSVRLYRLRAKIDYLPIGEARATGIAEFALDECRQIKTRALQALDVDEEFF